MAFKLTAEKVQQMEELYEKYYLYVNDTRLPSSERNDPTEFSSKLVETQGALYEQVLGKQLDFHTATCEDVKKLADHVVIDKKVYGEREIDDSNYKDVLIDISRHALKRVVERTPGFHFMKPNVHGPSVIDDIEEVKLEQPVLPKRLGGLFAASSEQMDEYRKQMDLYQRQQERTRIREKGDSPFERMVQRDKETDAFYDRLQESKKEAFHNSQEYLAVVAAMKKVNSLSSEIVNMERTKEFLEAHEALGKACEHYIDTREGAMTGRGSQRLELIKEIHKFQNQETERIGELREDHGRRQYEGRSFSEVIGELRTRKVVKSQQEISVSSGAMSKRYKLEANGVRGFFTEEDYSIDISSMEGITKLGEKLKTDSSDAAYRGTIDQIITVLGEADEADSQGILSLGSTTADFITKDDTVEKRKNLYGAGFAEYSATGKKLRDICSTDQGVTTMHTFMKACSSEIVRANVMNIAGIDRTSEMGKRHVATSRMASILGIDHLVAHSDRMGLQVGTKKMMGVFMAEASGYDYNKDEHRPRFANVRNLEDPVFQKQISTIYSFDLICGQLDRHPGNMLYNLIEEDGVTKLKGIQGIDNDMSFGSSSSLDSIGREGFQVKHGGLEGMNYIDIGFLNRMRAIERKDLDYALGDLLSTQEIDAVENRMQQVIAKAATIPQLQDDEWNKETAETSRAKGKSYLASIATSIQPTDYKQPVTASKKAPLKEAQVTDGPAKVAVGGTASERDAAADLIAKKARRMTISELMSEEKAETDQPVASQKEKPAVRERSHSIGTHKPKSM